MTIDLDFVSKDLRAKAVRAAKDESDLSVNPSVLLLIAWRDQVLAEWERELSTWSDELKAKAGIAKHVLGDRADYVVSGTFAPAMINRLTYRAVVDATTNMGCARPLWAAYILDLDLGPPRGISEVTEPDSDFAEVG